jgi:hypothetical protein
LNGASSVSGGDHPRRSGDDLARRKANQILLNANHIFRVADILMRAGFPPLAILLRSACCHLPRKADECPERHACEALIRTMTTRAWGVVSGQRVRNGTVARQPALEGCLRRSATVDSRAGVVGRQRALRKNISAVHCQLHAYDSFESAHTLFSLQVQTRHLFTVSEGV